MGIPPVLTYAQVADLRSYSLVAIPETDEELTRLLFQCETEIDNHLSVPYTVDIPRKIILEEQEETTIRGLRNATCAQAEYHLHMGEAFFVEGNIIPEGPDTTMARRAPKIAPKAMTELVQAGLIRMTGSMRQGVGVPPGPWTSRDPRRTV